MSPTDTEHRKLCHALLDAIEQGDIAAVEACYAPEMTMWFNVTGEESSRDDNLAALIAGQDLLRRRTYNDRTVNTFPDGFMVQYTCNVVAHEGTRVALWACLVAEVHDGRIVRLFEYLDSGKYTRRPRRGPLGARVVNEYEIRELCEAFFDAYQDGRVDVLDRLYADDCIVWHNVFGRETTRDENLARYPDSFAGQRRRTYNDRVINTFDDGFVIQYTLNGVMHTGHRGALWICIVGHCRDGRITRIDEYMDSSKFAAWMGPPRRNDASRGPEA